MNLAEITQASHGLYLDPSPDFVRGVLSDALAELTPPMTWPEWLDASDTLARLAECMVFALGGVPSARLLAQHHYVWRREIGAVGTVALKPDVYVALCQAYGVLPVWVQPGLDFTPQDLERIPLAGGTWIAPSAALALSVLRSHPQDSPPELLRMRPELQGAASLFFEAGELEVIESTCRLSHPRAMAFRIQIGDAGWATRRLRRP